MSRPQKAFDLPEIPPWKPIGSSLKNINSNCSFRAELPQSSKENVQPNGNSGSTSSSSLCSASKSTRLPLSNSKLRQQRTATTLQRRGVLRYGESAESLFQLDAASSPEYRELCLRVTDAVEQPSLEEEVEAWRRILELRTRQVAQQSSGGSGGGDSLLRLHRRATSRFSSIGLPQQEPASARLRHNLLHIWLSSARAQSAYGSAKDARQTLKYVLQTTRLGDGEASLYLQLAQTEELDQDSVAAERTLQLGIQKKAEPLEQLHQALRELQQRRKQQAPPKRAAPLPHQSQEQQSPKRLKTETEQNDLWNSNDENNNNVDDEVASDSNYHHNSSSQASQDSNMSIDNDDTDEEKYLAGETVAAEKPPKESIHFQLAPLHRTTNSTLMVPPLPTETATKPAAAAAVITIDQTAEANEAASKPASLEPPVDNATSTAVTAGSNKEPLSCTEPEAPKPHSLQPAATRNETAKSTPTGKQEAPSPAPSKDSTPRRTSQQFPPPLSSSSLLRVPTLQSSRKSSLGGATSSRPKLPPLKRFKATGLSGKAERVDPSQHQQSILESSDEEDDGLDVAAATESSSDTPVRRSVGKKRTPATKTKIPKMDLDYMWNWDPEKRNHHTPATKTNSSFKASQTRTSGLQMGKIDEDTPSLSHSSSSSGNSSHHSSKNNKNANKDKSRESTASNGGDTTSINSNNKCRQQKVASRRHQSLGESTAATAAESGESQRSDRASARSKLLDKANTDFLPLISEDNMLRVNNVPYIKLGVIGKGGSCKVYRALSKDCSVLAIKKVKLENLDRKAIAGYSNEIALLKRLSGNPSIIQLHDSEVDLQRKAIFLVMEPGEVDLNHVMQKQASSGGSSRLSMNFIRLTWQQMLKAVHSIHEERIIHGDLKPANFLFVRGTLKLIDFGIAKAIQSDDTTNIYRESQIGTLNYMSPEAILDSGTSAHGQRMKCGRVSRRLVCEWHIDFCCLLLVYVFSLFSCPLVCVNQQPSDIWSLGCILYQMVYGRTPFAELHMIPKLQAIVNPNHEIHYPSGADETAVDAMKQCLQRNPKDRAPIVGKNGLLNEHRFLNSSSLRRQAV